MATIAEFVSRIGKKCNFIVIAEKDQPPRIAINSDGTVYWRTCEFGIQYYKQHFTDKATPHTAYYDVVVIPAGTVECVIARNTDESGYVKHIMVHPWRTDQEFEYMWNLLSDLVLNSPFVEKPSIVKLVMDKIRESLLVEWEAKSSKPVDIARIIAQELNDAGLLNDED